MMDIQESSWSIELCDDEGREITRLYFSSGSFHTVWLGVLKPGDSWQTNVTTHIDDFASKGPYDARPLTYGPGVYALKFRYAPHHHPDSPALLESEPVRFQIVSEGSTD